jgi:phosphoglycolate phosphatase-like HAD superfamily hydrolase
MKAAKAVGWQTVLVGRHARDSGEFIECEHADHAVDTVHELQKIMPHLFVNAAPAGASE